MGRLLLVVFFLALTSFAGPAAAVDRSACVTSAAATYRHTFTGPAGTATIAAVAPLCSGQRQAFSLVSYTVGAAAQFVYDIDHAVVDTNHRSITLDVAVPRCATQVGAVFGRDVPTEVAGASAAFGNARLGSASGTGHRSTGNTAWYSGGTSACAPEPAVSFISDCDGGFTATLANRAGATVAAVFLVDAHTYRVAAGGRTTVVGDSGGSLTVRDNTFQTTTGTWSRPTVCVQPTTPPTTNPTLLIPTTNPVLGAPEASSAVPATAVSSAAAPPTGTSATTVAAAGGATFEAVTPAAAESAPAGVDAAAATASSSGSVALIALGVLLIGGGVVILGWQFHRSRQAD